VSTNQSRTVLYGGTAATPGEWVADSVVMVDEHGRIDLVGPWNLPAEAQGPAIEGLDMASDADIRSALLGGLAPGMVLDCRGLYVLPGLVAVELGGAAPGTAVVEGDPGERLVAEGITSLMSVAAPVRTDVTVIPLGPGQKGVEGAARAALRWWHDTGAGSRLAAFVGGYEGGLLAAVKETIALGVPGVVAINMASLGPAALAGVGRSRGALLRGYAADIIIVDENWTVVATLIGGKVAHSVRSLAVPEPDISELEWPDS